jgi:predicted DNA-binding transcriptional regulator AlpA
MDYESIEGRDFMQQATSLEGEGLIRSRDAARFLGVSEWLMREMAKRGELPYIQRTSASPMLFDRADLRKWIEREKVRGDGNSYKNKHRRMGKKRTGSPPKPKNRQAANAQSGISQAGREGQACGPERFGVSETASKGLTP